jgi:hypothetical protein
VTVLGDERKSLMPVVVTYLMVKVKVRPRTGHEDPEGEYRYSTSLSLTSALGRSG